MQASKEIQKYQKGSELLIKRLPFQRVVKEIAQQQMEGLRFQSVAVMALKEVGEAFLVGIMEQGKLVCNPREKGDDNAQRHPISQKNQGRFLR